MYNVQCIMYNEVYDRHTGRRCRTAGLLVADLITRWHIHRFGCGRGEAQKSYSFTPSFRLMSAILRRIYTDTPKMLPAYTKHCAM